MKAKVLLSAIYHRFKSRIKTCGTNISKVLNHKNSCDIHFYPDFGRGFLLPNLDICNTGEVEVLSYMKSTDI